MCCDVWYCTRGSCAGSGESKEGAFFGTLLILAILLVVYFSWILKLEPIHVNAKVRCVAQVWVCAGVWYIVYASTGMHIHNAGHFFDGGNATTVYFVMGLFALLLGVGSFLYLQDSDSTPVFLVIFWVHR